MLSINRKQNFATKTSFRDNCTNLQSKSIEYKPM